MALTKHAEFDVILNWLDEGDFKVTILFNAPGDIEDYQYFRSEPVHIDLAALDALRPNAGAYGQELGRLLFGQRGTAYLDRALRLAADMPVYMRLVVGDDAPLPYRTIRWEALCHPESGARITTSENIRFCRYLSNPDGTPPSPLSLQGRLSALVVVANPQGIEGYSDGLTPLSPVDVDAEIVRATRALGDMSIRILGGEHGRATRESLVEMLRAERAHVLYLMCHGMFGKDGPVLFLENERGAVEQVAGLELAASIADVGPNVPTLAMLISCQSAGPATSASAAADPDAVQALAESATSLTAFGPALSRAGSAVVVAMQGDVAMDTAARFVPRFFKELRKDGIAAHAMATARSALIDEPDWYVPVLYSRLKRASTWYVPRFGRQSTTRFGDLHTRIAEKECTPIVGSGIAAEDGVLPTREDLASDWARRRQAPILDDARTDLASVAQYVAVDSEDRAIPRLELVQYLRSDLKSKYGAALPGTDWWGGSVNQHISAVGRNRRAQLQGTDCHSRLAALDLPIFITSAWNSLLEDALRDAEKEPITQHFEWYRSVPSEALAEAGFDPKRPLVYHLFGTLDEPKSLVLTEDDYFAWLRAWIKQVDKGVAIPHYIGPTLMANGLLFLGYGFDDWEFRMIFEAIKGFEGSIEPSGGRHVGVQLKPGALRIERDVAQEYLEGYFARGHLDVYWGSCSEFLNELAETAPERD